jgi:hypothetical protein
MLYPVYSLTNSETRNAALEGWCFSSRSNHSLPFFKETPFEYIKILDQASHDWIEIYSFVINCTQLVMTLRR